MTLREITGELTRIIDLLTPDSNAAYVLRTIRRGVQSYISKMGIEAGPSATPIAELNLPLRTHRALMEVGITTAGLLAQMTRARFCKIRNIGNKGYFAASEKLATLGLKFRE